MQIEQTDAKGETHYFILYNYDDKTTTVRHYVTDALGSVIGLADDTGVMKTTYTYDPFGNTTVSGEASDNPFQYTGRENDGTGLYYYRARYYSPDLQRFISEDPIGLKGGDVNFYAYVGNNPVNYTDPLGLFMGKCIKCDEEKLNKCLNPFIASDACEKCSSSGNPTGYDCKRCHSEVPMLLVCYLKHCSIVDCKDKKDKCEDK